MELKGRGHHPGECAPTVKTDKGRDYLMPNIHTHCLFDMHFFGVKYREYEFVHNVLDHGTNVGIDYQRLFAVKHRHFLHDERAVEYVAGNFGYLAGMIAKGHIALDIVYSYSKREISAGRNKK